MLDNLQAWQDRVNSRIKTEINLSPLFLLSLPRRFQVLISLCIPKPVSVVYSSLDCHADLTFQRRRRRAVKGRAYRPTRVPVLLPSLLPSLAFTAATAAGLCYMGGLYGAGYQTVILGPLPLFQDREEIEIETVCIRNERRWPSDILNMLCRVTSFDISFSFFPIGVLVFFFSQPSTNLSSCLCS